MTAYDLDRTILIRANRDGQDDDDRSCLQYDPSPRHSDTPLAEFHNASQTAEDILGRRISVSGCRLIMLPKIGDARGNLTFIEEHRHIPFSIKRMYYLYDIPGGGSRGGHAHRKLEQFLIAIAGSFDIVLDDGSCSDVVTLNRSFYGLYIPNMVWRELINFSSGSVCAVLASDYYEESDYIRAHSEFVEATRPKGVGGPD